MKLFLKGNLLADLQPGEEFNLANQPSLVDYLVEVGSKTLSVRMRQEGRARNGMIVFYLREDGEPVFMRAFENTAQSQARTDDAEPRSDGD